MVKDMEKVTPMDIRNVMLGVEGRGSRDVAKRIHETTGQIFRYAIAHGKAMRNPAADFKPRDILLQAKSENFARVDVKDLPELLAKMDDYWGDAITRFALKLVAYTFVRTSELMIGACRGANDDTFDQRRELGRVSVDHPGIEHLGGIGDA